MEHLTAQGSTLLKDKHQAEIESVYVGKMVQSRQIPGPLDNSNTGNRMNNVGFSYLEATRTKYCTAIPILADEKRRRLRDNAAFGPGKAFKPYLSAYGLFFRTQHEQIKASNPSSCFGEVSSMVSALWRVAPDDVRQSYKHNVKKSKEQYMKSMEAYGFHPKNKREKHKRSSKNGLDNNKPYTASCASKKSSPHIKADGTPTSKHGSVCTNERLALEICDCCDSSPGGQHAPFKLMSASTGGQEPYPSNSDA